MYKSSVEETVRVYGDTREGMKSRERCLRFAGKIQYYMEVSVFPTVIHGVTGQSSILDTTMTKNDPEAHLERMWDKPRSFINEN